MRLQPGTGTANWLRDHLDHQLPILLGRSGPFAQCSPDEHVEPRITPADQPPPGWWETGDDTTSTSGPHPPPLSGPGTPATPQNRTTADPP